MIRASDGERRRLHDDFARLCAVASPSRSERACAELVGLELGRLGLEVEEDDAGAAVGGDCGNLLARVPGRGAGALLICTHLDTVPPSGPIEPALVDGAWVNAGEGILGADNKAAVAVALGLARRLVAEPAEVTLELLFTVVEEDGLAGAKAFDAGRLASSFGYTFDHASPIGEIVTSSPTYYRLEADFRGLAAHAGIRPEAGRNAVLAAARAVAAMRLGRLDEETTANIGVFAGGTAANVVPGRCRVVGEARSVDPDKAERAVTDMVDRLGDAANTPDCECDLDVDRRAALRRLPHSARAARQIRVAEAALADCGYEPRMIATGGGSDTNVLLVRGFRARQPGQRNRAQPSAGRASQRGGARGDARRRAGPRAAGRRRATRVLALRRGVVVAVEGAGPEQRLVVELAGERRPAIADRGLVGECREGDEVIVNVAGRELGLGSGGFDIVHVNLTRGLAAVAADGPRVMKLNYTSIQHAVATLEGDGPPRAGGAVAVIGLHGQLAPLAWALAQARPGLRVGYVQTPGGALAGSRSEVVRELRARGTLAAHVTAAACYGGADGETVTTIGAIDHGLGAEGGIWRSAAPGPGILGSASTLGPRGHGRSRLGPCGPLPGGDHGDRPAHVQRRSATAPPGHLAPHADGARPGAGAGDGGAAGGRRGSRRGRAPRLAGRGGGPRRLRRERPAGADDGADDRRGPAVLRRGAGRRGGRRGPRLSGRGAGSRRLARPAGGQCPGISRNPVTERSRPSSASVPKS